ncbi:MAG TPA: ABC-type transport auxiliary lipoprotein family protein [bacterium]
MKQVSIVIASTLLFLTLSNCGGVPPTYYYKIDYEVTDAQHSGILPVTIGVGQFSADVLYESDKIVYRDSPYEVQFYHYRRWIAQPKKIVAERIFQQFRAAGLFQRVVRIPSTFKIDYILRGRITSFEEWDEGQSWYGVVTIEFQLHTPDSNEVVWENVISEKTAAAKKEPADVVKAISESLNSVVAKSVAGISEHLKAQVSKSTI